MSYIGQKIETTTAIFGSLIRNNCLLVDKTLLIKEFITGKDTSLIVRPRRFGKTSNLSMLQHFFSPEVIGVPTKGLFNQLAIAKEENGEFLKKHQGQYPVIFITFKDTKEPTFESTINQLRDLISEVYEEHKKLLLSKNIDDNDKAIFQKYLTGQVNNEELQKSLKRLNQLLYKAYDKKAIILIDEYDTPFTHAYQYNFLEPLSNFMRDLFSSALKDNPYLEKGLMTGILRISKNNMLSGLNNLEIYTLLNHEYSQYFGFTEDEVKELVHYTKNDSNLANIRAYYNGYQIGGQIIYNPWSTMKFLDKRELAPYWVWTSNDGLLNDLFLKSSDEIKTQLGHLIQGKSIFGHIDVNLRYIDLINESSTEEADALWTLLLFCGYLTIQNQVRNFDELICQLKIPNKEILAQYRKIFKNWFIKKLGKNYTSFLTSLVTGNIEHFTQSLGDYLMSSLSVHDVHGKKSEKFYHGFVAGLIASIRDTHWVKSNGESGRGLYDLMLIPKDKTQTIAIIIEFKQTRNRDALKNNAEKALAQINTQAYDALLKQDSYIEYAHLRSVLKVGLAFCEKAVLSAYQHEELLTHQNDTLTLTKVYYNEAFLNDDEDL